MTGQGERMGIFLLDTFGNEILLHAPKPSPQADGQAALGCFDPLPLAARPRPPLIPSPVDYTQNTGTFFVADVYRGTGMERVPRGTIKKLRVVEAPPKRNWTGPMWNMDTFQAPALNYNCTSNKRILGDVPVEADGSAHFEVPAEHVGLNHTQIEGTELCGSQVNFTRPELSPCLAKFADKNDARYREALAIIQAGKERLARQPREDMLGPNSMPVSALDLERDGRCRRQSQGEAASRQALVHGSKVFDP